MNVILNETAAKHYNVRAMEAQRQQALGLALVALLILLIVVLRRLWSGV